MNAEYKDLDINSLVSTWLYDIKQKDKNFKPASFTRYEGVYRNYIKDSSIGFLKVFSCKSIHIQKYYNKLSEAGKTESQIKNLNKVLSGAFNYAIHEGFCFINPCASITIPKEEIEDFDETDDDSSDFFEYEELLKIIHECIKNIKNGTTDYFYFLTLFSVTSGLRLGEATGLQRKYFFDYQVKVRKELSKIKKFKNNEFEKYEYKLVPVKTKTSNRTVTMATIPFDIISNYIETTVKNIYINNNKPFNDDSLIFVNVNCGFIDQSNLRTKWVKFLDELNIPFKKWHKLRAGFACLLFMSGADIKTVQELLGHSDINTTASYYLRVFPNAKKDVVNNMNKLFLS